MSLVGPARSAAAATYVPIAGAGSTLSANAIQSWAASLQLFGIPVHYSAVGSTAGRAEFKQGTVDWAASDIPYGSTDGASFDPPPSRGFAYIPDTATATTFMYNLTIGGHRVTNLRLSGANVAKIFTGVLTQWNDPTIAADNPGLTLPAIPIVPVVRSDASGSTAQFTQWMVATEGQFWTSYCAEVGRNPCTQTSVYPVLAGSNMVALPGDLGVPGYVSQAQAAGAIGFVEYPYAIQAAFPVAQVLNAAGYYTEPTAGHVGVSLLKAKINMNRSDPATYLTEDLSEVYTDLDPRTYELSWYSYMILPTDTSFGFTTAKGFTLGDFGKYVLCDGQTQVDARGYSALPINLVEAGFAQLQKIPGAQVPPTTTDFIRSCRNPTFSTDGTNTLAMNDPQPRPCDHLGPTQCTAAAVITATSVTGQSPVPVGGTVTLNATVTPASAGTVEFIEDDVPLGAPVTVVNGAAQMSTSVLAIGTHTIIAKFAPTDTNVFLPSTSIPITIMVVNVESRGETINVNVPSSEGVFTMMVSDTPVRMSAAALSADERRFESTGDLGAVTISDGRSQSQPGWSMSGQVSDFTGGGHTVSGTNLGWAPVIIAQNAADDVVAGPAVSPGTEPGLKGGSNLANAAVSSGLGTTVVGAALDLTMLPSTAPGLYAATLTITAVDAG